MEVMRLGSRGLPMSMVGRLGGAFGHPMRNPYDYGTYDDDYLDGIEEAYYQGQIDVLQYYQLVNLFSSPGLGGRRCKGRRDFLSPLMDPRLSVMGTLLGGPGGMAGFGGWGMGFDLGLGAMGRFRIPSFPRYMP